MLALDSFEVGRNDAANITNAVFGARVMGRRRAAMLAGVAVIIGASFSSAVMDTARKGIFDPNAVAGMEAYPADLSPEERDALTAERLAAEETNPALRNARMAGIAKLISIYISVYVVDTILLYTFSAFGMPVSTTALLVFELVGASLFLGGAGVVSWGKVGQVVAGIVVSIIMAGFLSFFLQRVVRGAVRHKSDDRETLLLHGPWIAGGMLTFQAWFLVFKGLKAVPLVDAIKAATFDTYGEMLVLIVMWGVFTLLVYYGLLAAGRRGAKLLFPGMAVLGMLCLAFAFGQNDLANAASPGLSALVIFQNQETTVQVINKVDIPRHWLFLCGLLMAGGMLTSYAQRVTRAAVNTGSQYDHVALYSPRWCMGLAHGILNIRKGGMVIAPPPAETETGKKIHFDALRASVIMAISASVIAYASGHGLPVSTTYVTFAAILGTALGDRVFQRGDSDRKLGRFIWVVTCWFLAPVVAIVATGLVALAIHGLQIAGLALTLAASLGLRLVVKRIADRHEQKYHKRFERDGDHDPDGDDPTPA
jgi:phosphate/sulfate permease